MRIDPYLITMDILVIAASDANKPLLNGAMKVLNKTLELRGAANYKGGASHCQHLFTACV